MKVKWTPGARADLRDIIKLISRDRPQAARRLAARIRAATTHLRDHPDLGRMVSEFNDPSLREIIIRPYRVIYRLEASHASILAVIHSRRLLREAPNG